MVKESLTNNFQQTVITYSPHLFLRLVNRQSRFNSRIFHYINLFLKKNALINSNFPQKSFMFGLNFSEAFSAKVKGTAEKSSLKSLWFYQIILYFFLGVDKDLIIYLYLYEHAVKKFRFSKVRTKNCWIKTLNTPWERFLDRCSEFL